MRARRTVTVASYRNSSWRDAASGARMAAARRDTVRLALPFQHARRLMRASRCLSDRNDDLTDSRRRGYFAGTKGDTNATCSTSNDFGIFFGSPASLCRLAPARRPSGSSHVLSSRTNCERATDTGDPAVVLFATPVRPKSFHPRAAYCCHCLTPAPAPKYMYAFTRTRFFQAFGGITVQARAIHPHPSYDANAATSAHDIGVVVLPNASRHRADADKP